MTSRTWALFSFDPMKTTPAVRHPCQILALQDPVEFLHGSEWLLGTLVRLQQTGATVLRNGVLHDRLQHQHIRIPKK